MSVTDSLSLPAQTSSPVAVPSMLNLVNAADIEPPASEEWKRAWRALAMAFFQHEMGETHHSLEERLIAAHKLTKAWEGAAH